MKTKKILATMGICVAMATTSVTAFAAPAPNYTEMSMENTDIQPRVNWTGKARLGTSVYYNVTSSNNIFRDSPKVTNHSGNPGRIRCDLRLIYKRRYQRQRWKSPDGSRNVDRAENNG